MEEGSGRSLSALVPDLPSKVLYGVGGAYSPTLTPQTHNAPALPAIGQELQESSCPVSDGRVALWVCFQNERRYRS